MYGIIIIIVVIVIFQSQGIRSELNVSITKRVDDLIVHTLRVRLATNGTILDALKESALSSEEYSFSGQHYPSLGFYVQSIGGLNESVEQNKYWFVYRLDRNGTHVPTDGVSTPITDDSHYVFHYKTIDLKSIDNYDQVNKPSQPWLLNAKRLFKWFKKNIGF